MANRNTLHISKLEAFKNWLIKDGWEILPLSKNPYEVFLKDCTKYGNKTADQQSKSYDTMMMYEVKDLVDELLEIVKEGGTDAEH